MKIRSIGPIVPVFAFACGLIATIQAKEIIPSPPDVPVLGELEPYLIKQLGETQTDNEASLANFNKDPEFLALVKKYQLQLFNGPMVGCVTATSARIWVRTAAEASVQAIASAEPGLDNLIVSRVRKTSGGKGDFVALLDLKGLEPDTRYHYNVIVNGRSVLRSGVPAFRTFPSKGSKASIDVVFGGGARHNPPKEHIWKTIESRHPHALLLLGDNLYIDKENERNIHNLYYYRRMLRQEYRSLIARTSVYSIWDDHDFGLNDCAGGPEIHRPAWKFPNWKIFRRNWNNPYYGGGSKQPGCWYDFSIGDVDFFMTDGRYYRFFKDGTMLGPVQKTWLIEKLRASKATFKVIASGTLWTEHADKKGKDSWEGVKEEREEIFAVIREAKIGGVILISADRHRADVYKLERPGLYPLYEFESSKLTNNHTHGTKKEAVFSYNEGNFFGLINFDLTKADPELTYKVVTIDNKDVYTLTLKRSQLVVPE